MSDLNTYRAEKLEEARRELSTAREALATAATTRARRDAAEDVEFWGNRAAYLEHVRTEG